MQVAYTLENLTGNRQTVTPQAEGGSRGRPARAHRLLARERTRASRDPCSSPGSCATTTGSTGSSTRWTARAAQTVAAAMGFSIALPDLAAGAHKVVLKPVDVNGVAGLPVEVVLHEGGRRAGDRASTRSAAGGPPRHSARESSSRATRTASCRDRSRSRARPCRPEYSLGGGAAQSLPLKKGARDGERVFEIALPKGLAPGRFDIAIKATDAAAASRSSARSSSRAPSRPSPGIVVVDGRLGSDGRLTLDGGPLAGYVTGGAIQKAELDPPTALLAVAVEGQVFRVSAAGTGVTAPTRIRVTAADGSVLASDPITFVMADPAPTLVLELRAARRRVDADGAAPRRHGHRQAPSRRRVRDRRRGLHPAARPARPATDDGSPCSSRWWRRTRARTSSRSGPSTPRATPR